MSPLSASEALAKIKAELEAAKPRLVEANRLCEELWEDLEKERVKSGGAYARGLVSDCDTLIEIIETLEEV